MPGPNRPPSHGPTRRQFLTRAALLAAAAPTLPAFLAACSKGGPASGNPTLTLASPDSPVKWDIADDNKAIADGLEPEKGATLQLYTYADYTSPDAVKSFEDRYGVKVEISTFNDTDEAITKIRGGSVSYDIYFPSYDQISRLVTGKLVQPLNHSYITNIDNDHLGTHDGDFDRGEYYLEETRKRAEAQSPADPYMKALAYNNLAWMYLRGKQYGKALPPAQEGLRIAEVLGDKGVLSTINDTQAQILLAMKRFDEALSFSEKSLSGPAGSDYVSAVQYRTHATILASLDRKADSCKSLAKAQEFYAKARNEKERSATQQEAAALAC